jgi:aldehyde dehydrogenase (NAD+)
VSFPGDPAAILTGEPAASAAPRSGARPEGSSAAAARDVARAAREEWTPRPLDERAAVIAVAASLLAAEADDLARAVAAPGRRPLVEVWSGEIVPTIDALGWLAREGARALRPAALSRARRQWYFRAARHQLRFEPHGLVGIVTPSSSLLFLAVPQVAAALLAGNGVVWKPAPAGSAVAARVGSVLSRAGLPPGTLRIVHGGAEAARDLVLAGVDKLHFTGGSAAGLELYRLQAARGRPAVLELSGRHVAVVLDDADAALAARGLVWGKLVNGGRNCISPQLVLATRGIVPALVAAMREAMAGVEPALLAPEDDRRLGELVEDALARGARLVHGAPWPALVSGVRPGMRLVDEEVQGPVLALAAVASAADAIAWVNGAAHRLSASIWTSSPAAGRDLARRLDVGQVWLNDLLHPAAHPEVALAGRGESGFGASRGLAGLMEMVQPKVVSEMPLRARRWHHRAGDPGTLDLFRATARLAAARDARTRLGALGLLARALVRCARHRSAPPPRHEGARAS